MKQPEGGKQGGPNPEAEGAVRTVSPKAGNGGLSPEACVPRKGWAASLRTEEKRVIGVSQCHGCSCALGGRGGGTGWCFWC